MTSFWSWLISLNDFKIYCVEPNALGPPTRGYLVTLQLGRPKRKVRLRREVCKSTYYEHRIPGGVVLSVSIVSQWGSGTRPLLKNRNNEMLNFLDYCRSKVRYFVSTLNDIRPQAPRCRHKLYTFWKLENWIRHMYKLSFHRMMLNKSADWSN